MKQQVLKEGFTRVERDDRLLDVLPTQTREKGIELWEKWSPEVVELVRIRLPHDENKVERLSIPRKKIEAALIDHYGVQL